jgi:hypothetical protein
MATIFEKLNFTGIEIGRVQSVDEMAVVPILGANRGNVAEPECLKFRRTTDYGTMVFENEDKSRPAIVPTNLMIRGKGAQDHAMAGSGVVMEDSSQRFETACCIEQRQGGLLCGSEEEDVLPIALRKALLKPSLRQAHSYSKLWENIKVWLRGLRLGQGSSSAHLRYFYDTPKVKDALENFAAEFEPVDGQIGAIIMFSGVPVGIEIMPTNQHWEAYWKLLIRGCYGAEMMRLKMLGKLQPSALILPEIPSDATPEKVKDILEDFSLHLRHEVLPILERIDVKSRKSLSQDGSMSTQLVRTDSGGGGDLIKQNNVPIYVSLVL